MVGHQRCSMKITIKDGLPYISVTLIFRSQQISFDEVIIDTGSTGSTFSIDKLSTIGITPEPNDPIYRVSGVGGSEFVFAKQIESLILGNLRVDNFLIEVGAMQYGFNLDGIVGMDFLLQTKAVIDLNRLEI